MVSLIDIGPLSEKVQYRGQEVPVQGLPALAIFDLLHDIPELRKLLASKSGLDENDLTSLIAQLPTAVASIIVAGMGNMGNKDEIGMAMRMTAGEQMLFLQAIIKMTFPQGVQSFVESLTALVPTPSGARGWGPATKSQGPSSNASAQDTESMTAGDTPQDS